MGTSSVGAGADRCGEYIGRGAKEEARERRVLAGLRRSMRNDYFFGFLRESPVAGLSPSFSMRIIVARSFLVVFSLSDVFSLSVALSLSSLSAPSIFLFASVTFTTAPR